MDRRDALRAVTVLALSTVASACDSPPTAPSATVPSPTAPSALALPGGVTTSPPVVLGPTTAPLPKEISHGPRDGKNVALTFHGQGDPVVVGRLLDEIAKGGVLVTVLAVGTWLSAEPRLAKRIIDAGHELGNHTQHHADIKRMTATQAHAEIDECARALRSVTGSIGRWFRPSQTQHATATIKDAAAQVGYPTCLSYDVDSLDYTDPGSAAVVATTLKAVRGGSIVSMHFGHEDTVTAMAPLLGGLRERGLTPVTVSELIR